jgi:hypothetical protein
MARTKKTNTSEKEHNVAPTDKPSVSLIIKNVITTILLAFVVVSIGYMIVNAAQTKPQPAQTGQADATQTKPQPAQTGQADAAQTKPQPTDSGKVEPTAAQTQPAQAAKNDKKTDRPHPAVANTKRFAVYYFHGKRRCYTCNMMQEYSEKAIKYNFAEELRQQKLTWNVVNIEQEGNQDFAITYGVFGAALVVAELQDNKPVRFEKFERIWKLVRDQAAFINYVSTGVHNFLGANR